jgi:aminoglycoside phosphotransferase (APT) family kinase protein
MEREPARPLSDVLARRLIAEHFPQLGAIRVTGRDHGVDHYAVEIDGVWIFRFPKRAEYEPALRRELDLLRELGPRLAVPVPRYEHLGVGTPAFPSIFAGYRTLAGTPAIAVPADGIDFADLAARVGGVLAALHAFPLREAERLGVVRLAEDEDLAARREEHRAGLDALRDALPRDVFDRCRRHLEGPVPPPHPDRPCLLHGDLSADHLLIDPTGKVSGLIDWTDAFLGDPAYDLAYLWAWQGEDLVENVLGRSSLSVDPGFRDRVRAYGVCIALDEIAYGIEVRRESNRRLGREALFKAFGSD